MKLCILCIAHFLNLVAQAKTLHCLLQDETAENAGRASFKSTNPRVIFVLGMQNYQVFSMMNVDHALLQKKLDQWSGDSSN